MFGLGFSELIVLSIIILLLIGPNQLPEMMKTVAKFVKEISSAQRDFKRTINQDETLRDVKESVEDVQKAIDTQKEKLKKELMGNDEHDGAG